jgi:hypothetical protein
MRRRLAEEFAIAARLHAEAVISFTHAVGKVSPDEYRLLRTAVKEAQLRVEAAGAAFDGHVKAHSCLYSKSVAR